MSEQSMKELLEQEDMPDIQERTVVKGVVVQVSRDEAYVDIGYKQEILSLRGILPFLRRMMHAML